MKLFRMMRERSLPVLLLGAVVLIGLTGCGKDGNAEGNGENESNVSGLTYVAEYSDMQGIKDISDMKEIDGVLHILSVEYGENAPTYKLYTLNPADGSKTEEVLEGATEGGYFSSTFFNEDGSLEVIEYKDEYDDEWNLLSSEKYINKYSADGTLISSEEASAKLQLEDDFYISHFMKDSQGNYLIGSGEQQLKIYSSELVRIGEIANGNFSIDGLCMTESGKIVASCWGNTGVDIAVVDVDGKKIGTVINTNKSSGSATVWSGHGDTVLYMNGNNLCSADVVNGEITVIMDLLDIDVNPDDIQSVYPLSDGGYLMSYYDYGGTADAEGVLIAKPVDPSTIAEKTELTIATIYTNQDLNDAVINFNRNSEEYRIKVVDYMTEDWDYDAAITNLQNDIVAGNAPDMIDVSSVGAPWRNWAAKGIITDLYPLMEADGDFTKEELLSNVRTAFEVDGSLYVLPTTVSISGVLVKEKFVEGVESLTPEFLLELEAQLPEGVDLFWYNYQGEVMYNMVYSNMCSFVDYEAGECYFDTDEFKAVLVYAKEQPAEMIWDDSVSLPAMLAEDKVIFYTQTMGQMPDWQFQKFVFGEDVTMLGYGDEGDGIKLMPTGCTLTISEQCEYKDVAWDFLKTFVSAEAQTGQYRWGIPVTQTGMDNFIYEAQHMDGEHGYSWDDVQVNITSATDEEVEEFLAIFEKADEVNTHDTAITAIIEEEIKPYFEGQKSVDEVADIIQSRVSIYLKENM